MVKVPRVKQNLDRYILAILFLIFCTYAIFMHYLPTFFCPLSCSTTTVAAIASPQPYQQSTDNYIIKNNVLRRKFIPFGHAAYSFILMSAYRGGPNTFAIIGLSSKPLQVYGNATYTCEYHPGKSDSSSIFVDGYKMLPDYGYGRIYTVVVINCTFPHETTPSSGGRLVLHTSGANSVDKIIVLNEPPNSWDPLQFLSPPKYDYLYCGGSLFGNLSPQKVREWIAYHVRLFGKSSHFVFHDAGGVHPEVIEVLKPWMELGYITLYDIREQEIYDGFYHNQYLVLNDCLHRYRFDTKWMFFFDVDEYIYVPKELSFKSVVDSLQDYTEFTIKQRPISNHLCLTEDAGKTSKKWMMEKLVYRLTKKVIRGDRKYAIQPRNVFATGVHRSQNFLGEAAEKTEMLINYFHYHDTIATRGDTCKRFINDTSIILGENPYVLDTEMRSITAFVKKFELDTIGSKLQYTKQ